MEKSYYVYSTGKREKAKGKRDKNREKAQRYKGKEKE